MPAEPCISRKVILRDSVTEDDIFEVTERNEWRYAGDVEPDPAQGTFYEARWATGKDGSLHYIVDDYACQSYMVAMDSDPRTAERVIAIIEQSLAVWSLDEAFRSYGAAAFAPSRAKSVLLLGLISPALPDDGLMERVRESSHHRDPRVRRASVWAMIYSEWDEYREDLARIASSDSDPEIAGEARKALDAIQQAEGGR
ncbi:hypothetical protein RCO28_09225 [Streptomyces sp. LHD-70]|uniref:hypothetical protein n=1 Tax=Streptomyces sp. LHD-70 TaxID=3072140 RepID=UPI00280EDE83|nr:hypothetical protein [Streptomyces sp. LHD-70]MDQ8702668.1 hypothetical protein [Streptomyces sp. LHD-70]